MISVATPSFETNNLNKLLALQLIITSTGSSNSEANWSILNISNVLHNTAQKFNNIHHKSFPEQWEVSESQTDVRLIDPRTGSHP